MGTTAPLHVRWLGRVRYQDALALQHALHASSPDDHLLLLEHPHTYTLGVRADTANVLVDPASVGAELVRTDRGGDVTYHGPGHLVGYPILHLPGKGGGDKPDSAAYVHDLEQVVIDALGDLGLVAGRLPGYPGVWVDATTMRPRKVCAIGVKVTNGKTMHGFGLNVDPDLAMFEHIVPCGIADKDVTSLRAEGIEASMAEVVDAIVARAAARWAPPSLPPDQRVERQDVVWRQVDADLAPFSRGEGPGETGTSVRLEGRLAQAGVTEGLAIGARKPDWMRAKVRLGDDVLRVKQTVRDLSLVTVCEEAGCPNLSECWSDGTATFMICGERCTRACGFCLVDTRHPEALDPDEPARVAEAVERMGLRYAVLTTVARDDLADGGASQFAATVAAIRSRTPGVHVETLISDCKGDPASLNVIFEARPDVLNHNIETVPRLQRAARPSAGYARSLAVLGRAKAAGLTTKSSIIVGMGETFDELVGTLADLRGIGVDIVTIGQYLRPTTHHLPVARWVEPAEFAELRRIGEAMGIGHVESGPLTRSSYHARQAADEVLPVSSP
ncbi:MAG: lipoyl synthase [Acidimicrobiales bacterium]